MLLSGKSFGRGVEGAKRAFKPLGKHFLDVNGL
jgi:hypothetical protein